jgi:hypothetical protein
MAKPDSDTAAEPNLRDPSPRSKLEALRVAIDEGDASGIAEGDLFARIREQLGLDYAERLLKP